MRVKIYELADQAVVEHYFGEDSGDYPMINVGERVGKLLLSERMGHPPDHGDVLVLPVGDDAELREFFVLFRLFYPASNSMEILVHQRHYSDKEMMS